MTRVLFNITILIALSSCGDKEVAECAAALDEIEAACSATDLPEVAAKACSSSKKAIATLEAAGKESGKTEVAAEGCKKQAETIKALVARSSGEGGGADLQPAAPSATKPIDGDAPAAGASAPAGEGTADLGPKCEKLENELQAACGDPTGLNPSQTAVCNAGRKSAELFHKLASKGSNHAETGCEKTLERWAAKGGLNEMIAAMAKK